jgi:hypothetical protein
VEERQAASRLEWQIEQWAEQQEREERQRALAEAEARREKERRSLQQRELAERLAREHRERAALQAAERTALQSQQTRDRLARLEAEEIQKQRHAAPWATFARLSNLLDPPAPEPASTTIYIEADQGSPHFGPDFSIEAVNRRWKFPWQP